MQKKLAALQSALGPQLAAALGGGSAGANTGIVASLPPAQKAVATAAYTDALRTMWILYVCVGAFGLAASLLIGKQTLSKTHEVTKTGLDVQERDRKERKNLDRAKRAEKMSGQVREKARGLVEEV